MAVIQSLEAKILTDFEILQRILFQLQGGLDKARCQAQVVVMVSDVTQKREAERRRILKSGLICFNHRRSVLNCTVRNISNAGAQLLLADTRPVPPVFELNVEIDGLRVPCQVMWRTHNRVGVRFTGPMTFGKPKRIQSLSAGQVGRPGP